MAALSETGVKKIGEYTFIYSGLSSIDKTGTAHGVAMCMNKESGAQWEAVNDELESTANQSTYALLHL